MYNPQMSAVTLELFLQPKGLASRGDADIIRLNPLGFLGNVLEKIEGQDPSYESCTSDFWVKYEVFLGKKMDEIEENVVREMVSDFMAIVSKNWKKPYLE